MRYWKVIESHAINLNKDRIYVSDNKGGFLKAEDGDIFSALNVVKGNFDTKFQEVTKEDYDKQCEEDETEADYNELCYGQKAEVKE